MARTVKHRIPEYRAEVMGITPAGPVETKSFTIPPCRSDKAALDYVRENYPSFSPAKVIERGVVYTTYEAPLDDFLKIATKKEG